MASLLDVILPSACGGCGRIGAVLCDRCLATFEPAADPRDRFVAADGGIVIGQTLTVAVAAFRYGGPLRKALGRLKYTGTRRLAAPMADAAVPEMDRLLELAGPSVLVPVPASPERLRERGYNQAQLLAVALGRATGQPVAELLARSRETSKQHRLDRAARLRNLRGAFAVVPGMAAPASVVLVDDILTTSATLEACASVLHSAGAASVYGFAIAREV